MHRLLFCLLISFFSFFALISAGAAAQSPDLNFTVIINQVRGDSCCSPGSIEHFAFQLAELKKNNFPATFALRYDVLTDQKYLDLAKSNQQFEYAAFLEIIPALATEAGVKYDGSAEFWYEAQDAYLIGYTQEERAKLIDAYMEKFREVFGEYPTTTVAWMIDSWSLRYLKEKYGVQVHELTREQYGTDSYALYGGPPHYPYWPTNEWALIPSADVNPQMPLIVRQTITDPVHNYGDTTNSYTSQPNDYLERAGANLDYFKHLFYQAHTQQNDYTFALIGLENSMAPEYQAEFGRQLAEVKKWQERAPLTHRVTTAHEFAIWLSQQPQSWPRVYHGQDQELGEHSQAWWITTPTYRARLRLDNQELYISDLRIYHPSFTDPYYDYAARNLGWWIVPFVLDGSRFFHQDPAPEFTDLARDNLTDRKEEHLTPTRLKHAENFDEITLKLEDNRLTIYEGSNTYAFFDPEKLLFIGESKKYLTDNSLLNKVIVNNAWEYQNQPLWGFQGIFRQPQGEYAFFTGDADSLAEQRQEHYPLLFPELVDRPINPNHTHVYNNNQYAIAGRNPVRLVLFPRDQYNFPTQITYDPTVSTTDEIDAITIKRQHGNNGMIFMDFENTDPTATTAEIKLDGFSTTIPIYFAPNCKQKIFYCLTHPRQSWWYVKSVLADRQRAAEMKNQ
ncbi:MAG TPA: hypothetical protein VF209_01050 [Patescibacteria group bacterium]